MSGLFRGIGGVLSSRAASPLVIGIFLIVYIVLAFETEETLITLMAVTGSSLILKALLSLVPISRASRLYVEARSFLERRRALGGKGSSVPEGLFDESVRLSSSAPFDLLQGRLEAEGYRTRRSEESLSAWRGISLFPARILFLAGTFCLFAGILVSVASRSAQRATVVEGEPLPGSDGMARVAKISLAPSEGKILAKALTMEVESAGGGRSQYGLYPPSLYRGKFVYPRYLGIAPLITLSAPDLPSPYQGYQALALYPAGKEDRAQVPGTSYKLEVAMAEPADGSDPFVTGRVTFLFKLLKGKELLLSGSAPTGGEFSRDGYRVGFPAFRRMVITDFIGDYGVLLIWTASLLLAAAFCLWLPVRLLLPRREMLFIGGDGGAATFSRAEGGRRGHGSVFHEALDLLQRGGAEGAAAAD